MQAVANVDFVFGKYSLLIYLLLFHVRLGFILLAFIIENPFVQFMYIKSKRF